MTVLWNWEMVVHASTFSGCDVGIALSDSVTSFVVIDSNFTSVHTAVTTSASSGLVLDGVAGNGVSFWTNGVPTGSSGEVGLASWGQGDAFQYNATAQPLRGPLPPFRSFYRGAVPSVALPQYGIDDNRTVVNVLDFGGVGDGVHDDTPAIRSALAAAGTRGVVFLPYGTYLLNDTVHIPHDSVLLGEGLSILAAAASSPAFSDASNPTPMLATQPAPYSFHLADLTLTVSGGDAPGVELLHWEAGDYSTVHDVHVRLYSAAYTMLHLRGQAGGYLENMWGWTADHDIATGNPVTVKNPRGFTSSGRGNLFMYGTAFEHSYLHQYSFTYAQNTIMMMSQTETPYWQSPPSAWGASFTGCTDMLSYGSGYYNWFHGTQASVLDVSMTSHSAWYAHNVIGSENLLSGDVTISNSTSPAGDSSTTAWLTAAFL
jgi:glucan 1,3-beta-glucosidase